MSGPKIQTYTGRIVDPFVLIIADVCLEDIAPALSQICRFTGHTKHFYSVAQHSVNVAAHVAQDGALPATVWWALMHDAHEAYLGDMSAPLKHLNMMKRYREACDDADIIIRAALDIPFSPEAERLVRRADHHLLGVEAGELLNADITREEWGFPSVLVRAPWIDLTSWSPYRAATRFLNAFKRYQRLATRRPT